MSTITTSIRTDTQLKREADRLFADLGPTRDAPNTKTLAAMREADRIATDPSVLGYVTVDELFADLDS